MADVVIRAEGLGKKYVIGHRARASYATLRDVIAGGTRDLARSVRDMAAGRPLIAGETFEEFWALRGVDFEIRRGEVTGVIGRNGAGKSTLLKVLSRITEPTEGRVVLDGRLASLLEVGTGFHPELTGAENIYLNGAILGMTHSEIRRRFEEIVDFAGVEAFLDTPVKRYSSGMYVRLAFSVAAHLEPDILVVDEVLAVGDAEFQRKCLGKMRDAAGGGRTVLFVSHSLGAVRALCSRALWLDRGRLRLAGDVATVADAYLGHMSARPGGEDFAAAIASRSTADDALAVTRFTLNEGGEILHGRPLTVALACLARRRCEDLAFHIDFAHPGGGPIVSLDSSAAQGPAPSLSAGHGLEVSLQLDTLHLRPGTYALGLSARSGPAGPLTPVFDLGLITVLPSQDTPAHLATGSAEGAGMRLPCRVALRAAAQEPAGT